MQNAKDTFYEMLRTRLAAVNPERTIVVRGAVRPGVLVEENELVAAAERPDCFRLRWVLEANDAEGALPLVTMGCEVLYETAGTALNGGMDRGRLLAALDGELAGMLAAQPRSAAKVNYSGLAEGTGTTALSSNVWWGTPQFGATEIKGDRLTRKVVVAVMSFQEAGEL